MTDMATYFRTRASAYELAAEVIDELNSRDGPDATLIRELDPLVEVVESDRSASTYVYLDSIKSRVSDHPGGAAGEISEHLDAAEMVDRWLSETRADLELA